MKKTSSLSDNEEKLRHRRRSELRSWLRTRYRTQNPSSDLEDDLSVLDHIAQEDEKSYYQVATQEDTLSFDELLYSFGELIQDEICSCTENLSIAEYVYKYRRSEFLEYINDYLSQIAT